MTKDDEFYVEDEPVEEAKAAFRTGEKGVTKGTKDLNQRAKAIVDRAAAGIDRDTGVEVKRFDRPAVFAREAAPKQRVHSSADVADVEEAVLTG